MTMRRVTGCLLGLTLMCSVGTAQQELHLERLIVCACAPVTITLPRAEVPREPMYRDAAGEWHMLEITGGDGLITFALAADAGGRTLVLLEKPEWLDLSDTEAPVFETLKIDGAEVEPAGSVDLGRSDIQPRTVELTVRDDNNPLLRGSLYVSLDGRPLEDTGSKAETEPLTEEGWRAAILIEFGDLPQEGHTLTLAIEDAAAEPHQAKMTIAFSTAPLLRNGGFEEVDTEGKPVGWSCSAWSQEPDTKKEFAASDQAHSGERALMIKGIAGSLNLVCGQLVPVTPGKKYRLTGHYLADAGGGYLSIIADDKGQYDSSPKLPAVEGWTEFSWEFTAGEFTTFTLYLRHGGKGTIYYDDVKLEEVE